jgi:ribose 5-phosphate isomerase B
MKIHLATDHAGYLHKEAIKEYLSKAGMEVIDHGAHELDPKDDYPDFIKLAAEGVSKDPRDLGIIFGYSGQGEAMVANRYPSIRAIVYYNNNEEIIRLSKEHNNANVLSIGAHFVSVDQMIQAVILWLATSFSNEERHVRRLGKF